MSVHTFVSWKIKKKSFFFFFSWKTNSMKNKDIKQSVSDESQFHQPPQEPSWKAHHAPKNIAKEEIKPDNFQ